MDINKNAKRATYRIENIQPILAVNDMQISKSFYKDILGFEEAEWGTEEFTSVNRDKSGIYLCKGAQGCPGTWVWMGFDGDINALHDELKAKGAKITMIPTNFSWAYEMRIEDPDGHILRLGTDPDTSKPFADMQV